MYNNSNYGATPVMQLGIHPVSQFSNSLKTRIQKELNLVGAQVDFTHESLAEDEVFITAVDFASQKRYGMKLGGVTNAQVFNESKTQNAVIAGLQISREMTDDLSNTDIIDTTAEDITDE